MNKINFFYPTLSGSVQPAPVIKSALDTIDTMEIGLIINFTINGALKDYTYEVSLGDKVAIPRHLLQSMQVTIVDNEGTQNMTLQLSITFEALQNNTNFKFLVKLFKNDIEVDRNESTIYFVKGGLDG